MRWRDTGAWVPWRAAVAMLLAGCSAGTSGALHLATPPAGAATQAVSAPRPKPAADVPPLLPASPQPSALPVAPGAGRLAQTQAFPSAESVAFRNAMQDLWLAVTSGKPLFALSAFFPEAAYQQAKAIAYPQADWQDRLWYDFTLDVSAAHNLLGKDAKLVRVIVPTQYAAWVYPGACYNSVGYWHVPGARVVYREGSQLRSFGIASLISWRGDWYVIHFGAVLRGGGYGEVDDPADGTGYPGPPGGC